MNLGPLSLLILANLLIVVGGHFFACPGWILILSSLLLLLGLAKAILTQRKQEKDGRAKLGQALSEMQKEVEKAARRYRSLLEGAGNAIFVFNADTGVLEELNRKAAELFGCSKEEMADLKAKDLFPPEEYDKFLSFIFRLKRRGRSDAEGITLQRKDGSLFQAEIDARVLELQDERVVHCIMRDISEKIAADREILQRNRELSILNRILTEMNSNTDSSSVLEETLQEIMDLFGASGGTIHLPQGGEGLPGTCARGVSAELARLLARQSGESGASAEVVLRRGEEIPQAAQEQGWVCLTRVPLVAGELPIGSMQLLHEVPCAYPEGELRFLASVGRQMGNALEKSRLFEELNWKSSELLRSHRLLEKASHNLTISQAKLRQNLAVVEQANLELSRLDRMKNQFLGMVSHEFNTPLTSIISGADLLLQEGRAGEREVLEMVRNGGLRLKDLVADLLKLIRLEARGAELNKAPMHLQGLMELLQEQYHPLLRERGQVMRIKELKDLPFFHGDVDYLERVFGELLLNAIKFTPQGGEIEVSGRVLEREELVKRRDQLERFHAGFVGRCGDRCFLEVRVKDNGIGIPEEELRGIFEIFYEVGEIRHHSSEWGNLAGKGAGLGLAIVKGMVEAHGGMVWAESGEGSSFFLILPLEQEAPQPELF